MTDTDFRDVAIRVLRNPAFCQALDDLSTTVMEDCGDFIETHSATLVRAGMNDTAAHAELVMALVVGWILGFHDDANDTLKDRLARMCDSVIMATVAAGYSAANTDALYNRSRH